MPSVERQREIITEVLAGCGIAPDPVGRLCWRLALPGAGARHAEGVLRDGFFMLRTPAHGPVSKGGAWDLLVRNATLRGLTKIVYPPTTEHPWILAELPLVGDDQEEIAVTVSTFMAAFAEEGDGGRVPAARASLPSGRAGGGAEREALRLRCEESGWPVAEHGPDCLTVDLGRDGGGCRALAAVLPDGTCRLCADLPWWEERRDAVRQAIGLLLLRAGGHVRVVRPCVAGENGGGGPRFEVCLHRVPPASLVDAALAALAVACRLYAAEVKALADADIAHLYLALQQGPRHGPA